MKSFKDHLLEQRISKIKCSKCDGTRHAGFDNTQSKKNNLILPKPIWICGDCGDAKERQIRSNKTSNFIE